MPRLSSQTKSKGVEFIQKDLANKKNKLKGQLKKLNLISQVWDKGL